MATPERPTENVSPSPAEHLTALETTKWQLELADEIENPIERTFKRDELLELIDHLQEEIEPDPPPASSQLP